MEKIILASGSPRRKELLERVDIDFSVVVSDMEEDIDGLAPEAMVIELSRGKALDVAGKVAGNHVIIGADTIVVAGGHILGKPVDEDNAFLMLKRLQGSSHYVYTGVTLLATGNGTMKEESFFVRTRVEVWPMSDDEIKTYIRTGEPMDKAGSYGIQGIFCKFVKEIHGDYENVVGLPISTLYQKLKKFNIK